MRSKFISKRLRENRTGGQMGDSLNLLFKEICTAEDMLPAPVVPSLCVLTLNETEADR